MFDHFIITRFNLKKTDWETDKNERKVLDESWLKERIQLFEKYCFPSVVGQSCKNFKWLIFFEKESVSILQPFLDQLNQYSFIEIVLLNGYAEFQNGLPALLRKRLRQDSGFVITTRLDNDDALNRRFVAELQKAIKEPLHDEILHFPNGLVLDTGKPMRLGSLYYPFNQFVSLVEHTQEGEIKTVFAREHDQWGDSDRIQKLELKDAWLQVAHSKNMVNSFRGNLAYSSRLKSFGIGVVKFKWNYDLEILYHTVMKRLNFI